MIYLDSCIVILLTEAPDTIRRVLRHEISCHFTQSLAISELTRLECLVFPLAHHQEVLLNQYKQFFFHPEVMDITFTADVWKLATHIRAEHGLQVPDALHLAVATQSGCQTFCTCDKKLAHVAEKFISVLIPSLPQGDDHV